MAPDGQMSDQPTVYVDFEFLFKSGELLALTLLEGRDTAAEEDAAIHLKLEPEPGVTETVVISRAELAYMRRIRRVVQPESTTQDGNIRIMGGTTH